MLKSFLRPICHFAIVLAAFAVGCGLSNAEDPRSLVDQGKEAFSRGDLDGALVKFNEAVRRSPENVDSHWWRARELEQGIGRPGDCRRNHGDQIRSPAS